MKVKTKEAFYSVLWVFTGILFGTLVAGLVVLLLNFSSLVISDFYSNLVFVILALTGALLGALAAPVAWSKIYVEGVRGKKYVISSKDKK